jgi:hypothetical protein
MITLGYISLGFLYLMLGSLVEGLVYKKTKGRLYITYDPLVPGVIAFLWPIIPAAYCSWEILSMPFKVVNKSSPKVKVW